MIIDLYRFYDAQDRLLYVGISLSAAQRCAQHRDDKSWWGDVCRMDVEHLDVASRREAELLERAAIRSESPRYNVSHNGGTNPQPRQSITWTCYICDTDIHGDTGRIYCPDRYAGENMVSDTQTWFSVRDQALCYPSDFQYPHWYAAHWDCEDEGEEYSISAERISSMADVVQWTAHLMEKQWFSRSDWGNSILRKLLYSINYWRVSSPTKIAPSQ